MVLHCASSSSVTGYCNCFFDFSFDLKTSYLQLSRSMVMTMYGRLDCRLILCQVAQRHLRVAITKSILPIPRIKVAWVTKWGDHDTLHALQIVSNSLKIWIWTENRWQKKMTGSYWVHCFKTKKISQFDIHQGSTRPEIRDNISWLYINEHT